jgi:hypothetical protein
VLCVLLFSALTLALSSCAKYDPFVVGDPPSSGTLVTLSLTPVVGGGVSPLTRTGYHGGSSDAELGDPGYGAPNLDPSRAGGSPFDVSVSQLRVLFYDSDNELVSNGNLSMSVSGSLPVTIRVPVGTYSHVVFIANEGSSTAPGYLSDFLSGLSSGSPFSALSNTLIESSAYAGSKNIPMVGLQSNVSILNHHTMRLNGGPSFDTRITPWRIDLTRTGVRLSVEIVMADWQFATWDDQSLYLSGVPQSSWLLPDHAGDAPRETTPRRYRAVAADLSDPSDPSPVPGTDGYYWSRSVTEGGHTTTEYVVRFDRLILPEALFAAASDSTRALSLRLDIGGMSVQAQVSRSFDPSSSQHDYTLPRNTWLHLDATISNTALELDPIVMNWNTLSLDELTFDGTYFLKVESDRSVWPVDGGEGYFEITTNHPGTISATHSMPSYVGFWGYDYTSVPDGGVSTTITAKIRVQPNPGVNVPSRSGQLVISIGNLRKTVQVHQMGSKDDAPPAGVTPYVGAFWRGDQTGERLIRIPRPASGVIDGPWSATVSGSDSWIVMDRMMTEDPNVGWLPGADESSVANGNDPGFDRRYAVYGTQHVEGTVSAADPDGIYFRIGLHNTYDPAYYGGVPARYGQVILSYTVGTQTRFQRIWIRQGEGADYLMFPSDSVGGLQSNRPLAGRFSPYNLTAAAFNDPADMTPWYNVREWGAEANGSPPAFANYPTQAGAFFQWANPRDGVRAYHPGAHALVGTMTDTSLPPGWEAEIPDNGVHGGGLVSDLFESCPAGYRRPSMVGTNPVGTSVVPVVDSEIKQSLFSRPANDVTLNVSHTENAVFGFYADGFFDRRSITALPGEFGGKGTNYVVGSGTSAIAYAGLLFYRPGSRRNSLFFPFSGYRMNNGLPGRVYNNDGNHYYMSSSGLNSLFGALRLGFHPERGTLEAYFSHQIRLTLLPIRCVKE